ncbi:methyltransferase domain-containing protein [Geomicrobium sediminis]|uniref:Ubiquinone/menaquinone biosynthesis C-methylase UbiE n=1 Tax=Geomicrobium sediminis TaxID=1347788 RepID=A0ABS2PED5_9BACL|nr:ubiquinone/menaquinone biosynthesis C-methylase UbiE [Geomicrobium sediminis]
MYREGASYYDFLMNEAPYERWKMWVDERLHMTNKKGPQSILDVGCGTGTFMSLIMRDGHDATGVDVSEDMLAIADSKIRRETDQVPQLSCQNMTELSLPQTYDVITVLCDSLNYVIEEQDVQQALMKFFEHLNHDGMLLFDVHSIQKMTEEFPGFSYGDNDPAQSLIWNSYAIEDVHGAVEHELSFFEETSSGLYKRYDELHTQRSFAIDTYVSWLEEAGFTEISVVKDFTHERASDQDERIFFIAKKQIDQ